MSSHSRRLAITLVTALSSLVLISLLALVSFSLTRPDLTWLDYDHDAQSLAEATRVPQILFYENSGPPTDVHTFRDDGELIVGIDAPRHPIFHILEQANRKWDSALSVHDGDVRAPCLLQWRLLIPSSKHALYCSTGIGPRAGTVIRVSSWLGLLSVFLSIPVAEVANTPLHLFTPIPPSLLQSRQREAEILPGQHPLHLNTFSAQISPDTFTLTLHSGVSHITYSNLSQSVTEEHRAKRIEHLLMAIQPFTQFL